MYMDMRPYLHPDLKSNRSINLYRIVKINDSRWYVEHLVALKPKWKAVWAILTGGNVRVKWEAVTVNGVTHFKSHDAAEAAARVLFSK